jgi:hypothetical protein
MVACWHSAQIGRFSAIPAVLEEIAAIARASGRESKGEGLTHVMVFMFPRRRVFSVRQL